MSKRLIGIIAIILLLTTTGCTKDETKQEPAKETETAKEEENTFSLNQTISYDDFDITFTKIEKVKDNEGKSVIKLTYNWTNKFNDSLCPFMTFDVAGFQDDEETEYFGGSDNIDRIRSLESVEPGETIENCEVGIRIEDDSKPIVLKLEEMTELKSVDYTMTINPSEL